MSVTNKDLLNYLQILENKLSGRIDNVEEHIVTINHELGDVAGKLKVMTNGSKPHTNGQPNPIAILLIKFVIFPLIVLAGGIMGVKLLLPF